MTTMMSSFRDYINRYDIDFFVFFLTIFFGLGSWLTINGLWVELPVIVFLAPESWKLSSYLSVIAQIANIGPIAVLITNHFRSERLNEAFLTYSIIVCGAVSCLLLAFIWNLTTEIGGQDHSIALIILVFFLALSDCTSTVTFLPFMSAFKPYYMTGLYVGEGMSGLIPAFVALGQGVGSFTCNNVSSTNDTTNVTSFDIKPVYSGVNFPVQDFFFILTSMMILCGIAFTMLKYLPYCKREHVVEVQERRVSQNEELEDSSSDCPPTIENGSLLINTENKKMKPSEQVYWLAVISWINFVGNGFLPSISTYFSIPYGSDAFHLSATLGNIANPLSCILALLFPLKSLVSLSVTGLTGSVLAAYLFILGLMSPKPFLVGTQTGSVLMVTASVGQILFMTYTKVRIAVLFRMEGKRGLFNLGAFTQLGALMGSITAYILVNICDVFQDSPQC